MFITLITDCADANTQGRQETRIRALFNITPTFVPIPGTLDMAASLEASGNIIDVLDAAGDAEGIILANVAPRHSGEKGWGNGTPFGYFRHKNVLVCTTLSSATLALPKKFGLVESYQVFDLSGTLQEMAQAGALDAGQVAYIAGSQFRSFDFLPRAAWWVSRGHAGVVQENDLAVVAVPEKKVWIVDNFGNAKTTLLARELSGDTLQTKWGVLPVVLSLKDVPDGTVAAIVGSSGYGPDRFVEIVSQGKSAAHELGIVAGESIV